MKDRNIVRVQISHEMIIHMMTEGWKVEYVTCTKGLPKDATFERGYTDDRGDVFWIFSHESFEPVRDGEKIPELTPTFQVEYP